MNSGASVALELHAVSDGIRNGDWVEGSIGVAAETVRVHPYGATS